ncbi:testicular haploid expressed gene protein [Choloepus didactylus]|uniref:testicular haploid expressed gene protein n=1 Tax=Choloepus didactylus TaxID=27675 RepID=UPI00189DDD03|nr:testicular haploid expressed gene protein [Choloepus didactylus]
MEEPRDKRPSRASRLRERPCEGPEVATGACVASGSEQRAGIRALGRREGSHNAMGFAGRNVGKNVPEHSPVIAAPRATWVRSEAGAGLRRPMGDPRQGSLGSLRTPRALSGSDGGLDKSALGLRGARLRVPELKGPKYQDPEDGGTGSEDQEEVLPELEMGEEFLETQSPQEALSELERVLEPDSDEDLPEVSRLSITPESQGTPRPKGKRRRRRRVFHLAKPKTNWQVLKDRVGCTAWLSPCKMSWQFSLYWPSVYWTERFLEDTTLSVTVPAVSPRVEELSRPKRFYSEYYNNRTTPVWPIPRATLEYQPSGRLKELATPKVRNNIWRINMSEVSQVSRAAQLAVPSPRILWLAKPRAPATLLEEWDPMPKPKPHVSNYSRLLRLAMPKLQSDKCVPDWDPRWEVLDVTKKAVASPRIVSLARPKLRKDLNEGYDRRPLASSSSPPPKASPKKCDLPGGLSEPRPQFPKPEIGVAGRLPGAPRTRPSPFPASPRPHPSCRAPAEVGDGQGSQAPCSSGVCGLRGSGAVTEKSGFKG